MSFVLKKFSGTILYKDKLALHSAYIESIKRSLYGLNGFTPPNKRQFFVVKYLEKVFEYSVSSFKLVPGNRIFENHQTISVWDVSSFASLVRCMMDCYLNFVYLVASPSTEKEFQFRLELSNLKAEVKRLEILRFMNSNSAYDKQCQDSVEEALQRLHANSCFMSLPEKEKVALLKRPNSIPIALEKLAELGGINLSYYKSLQRFLSCHSHFFGYALSQFLVFDPHNEESQQLYFNCLDFAALFMAFFLRDISCFHPHLCNLWHPEVSRNIEFWNHYMAYGHGEANRLK